MGFATNSQSRAEEHLFVATLRGSRKQQEKWSLAIRVPGQEALVDREVGLNVHPDLR
jgi:hypothetical protein